MPLCTNCGHPHGWYQGLCAACASAAGVALVPAPAPELEAGAAVKDEAREPKIEEAQPEPPKATRRRRTKR